jgi:tetratricopeptide (TPR) repeat protein
MSEEIEENEGGIDELIEQFDELLAEAQMDEARELIEGAISDNPDEVMLHASLAELEIELENYERGVEIIDGLLEQTEDDEELATLLNLKAYACYYLNDLDLARRTFNRALRHEADLWSGLIGRATVHERMGFLVAALLDLEHAIDIDDQEADPFSLRARIFLKRGEIEQAERDYGYTLESNPYDEEARINLARILARNGNTGGAIELLELLIEEGENTDIVAVGSLLRSQLSMTLGSTGPALEDAQLAIEHWPEHPWGYLQAAACHLASGNPDETIKSLKEAEKYVTNVRDVPDITALRASAYEQLEKHDQARREKAKVEGMPRLPAIVYGGILNPAANVPINPDRPIDIRAILTDLFGNPDRAPKGYEDALRDVVDKIPEIIEQNPGVEKIQIELPEVEGMRGQGARNLVIQVNQNRNQGDAPEA